MSEPHLRSALDALERGDRGAALEALLAAWRAERSPALANCLTDVGDEAARGLTPIAGRTRRAFQQAWLDVANQRRAADVPRVLAGLAHPPWTMFRERVTRLELYDDPRVALAYAKLIEERPVRSSLDDSTWRMLFRAIERMRDPRCLPHLERAIGVTEGLAVENMTILPECRRLTAQKPPPVAEPDAQLLQRVLAASHALARGRAATPTQLYPATQATSRSEDELLAAVYAAPDDDGPRRVYADWLLERGDPRGELITLQFEPKRTAAKKRRERELIERHAARWLGPLEPVVDRKAVEFERGFLSTAAPRFRTPQQLKDLGDHPAWSTVRVLSGLEGELQPLLVQCELKGLWRIEPALSTPTASALATRDRPLRALATATFRNLLPPPEQRHAVAEAKALPALRELTLVLEERDADLAWLAGSPLVRRLDRLTLEDRTVDVRRWLTTFPEPRELNVLPGSWHGSGPRFRFRAVDGGREAEVARIVNPLMAVNALKALEGVVQRVTLYDDGATPGIERYVAERLKGAALELSIVRSGRG